ncbi:MAG TPA: hypothetical protein VG319_07875 [Polyangia bacterium]|jgi:hypothetical protein|nr:hypothetical protein [Polyangia bacterium]
MMALLPACLWLALQPVVVIESEATCPTATDVAERVTALLPVHEKKDAPDLARISDRGDAWIVTLALPDGTPVAERVLDRAFPCADLASAAAVIIATWESDVHPEFRPAPLPAPPPRQAPPVAVAPRPPAPAPSALDVGAALTGSLAPSASGAGPAIGALVVASWLPSSRGVGARLALAADAARELPLGPGRVQWRRIAAALGPTLRLPSATTPWALDLYAEALVAGLLTTGAGFTHDFTDTSFDAGLGGGTRLFWRGRTVEPWVELDAGGWLRQQTAFATPGTPSVDLPRLELSLALGLSLNPGP